MQYETPESELARLRGEQSKLRQDWVFGGLSAAERAAYEKNKERIHDLEQRVAHVGQRESSPG
jgi:hypothetical protein